ncbi:DUF1461 domain-containing protein [Candidatus Dojkabacteria bacterium]|nr:DUF1461 domain-containing protein [Candidatus Dojkabacteria bacterium]
MNSNSVPVFLLVFTTLLFNILFPVFVVVNTKILYLNPSEPYEGFASPVESRQQFEELFKYITFRRSGISSDFYSKEDILHMKDVRYLLVFTYLLLSAAIASIITTKSTEIDRTKATIIGSVGSIIFAILICTSVLLFSFDFFSNIFHTIFFRNDYWLLDPTTSSLIKFFPQENLQFQATFIILLVMLTSIVQIILAWKNSKKKK